MELPELLALLRTHGVQRFKDDKVEVVLFRDDPKPAQVQEKPAEVVNAPEPPDMPPDLRADALMNFDTIRDWSASPDPAGGGALPLTGDAPISGDEP